MASKLHYRPITPQDEAAMAKILRDNLKADHLDIPGTAYFDPSVDHLSAYYAADPARRAYYVVTAEEDDTQILGGIGFAEFEGREGCAELQKLYLTEGAKGQGLGYQMIRLVEEKTRELGYRTLYLETHTNLQAALHIYERYGFTRIPRPDCVGHSTMNRFYELDLRQA